MYISMQAIARFNQLDNFFFALFGRRNHITLYIISQGRISLMYAKLCNGNIIEACSIFFYVIEGYIDI